MKQLFHIAFLLSEGQLLKERICSSRSKFFPIRVDPFLSCLYEGTGRGIALPLASALALAAAAWTNCSSFYVMGKALSGELSCTQTGLVGKFLLHGEANRK